MHWKVNAWYGGLILMDKTLYKSPFDSVKMVICNYIIN
jgi:hypothetical protein